MTDSFCTIDDKEYAFSDLDGKMTVPGDTNRIVIKFSVLSYVNRGDIQVKYYLDGFDDKDRVVSGTDNLGSRVYKSGGRKLYICAFGREF